MQIFIYAGRTYTIEVEYHDTVAILKEKFYKKTGNVYAINNYNNNTCDLHMLTTYKKNGLKNNFIFQGINCERQRLRLIHRCKQLEDTRSLSEYDINKESTVYLVHTLPSCKKCPGRKYFVFLFVNFKTIN